MECGRRVRREGGKERVEKLLAPCLWAAPAAVTSCSGRSIN